MGPLAESTSDCEIRPGDLRVCLHARVWGIGSLDGHQTPKGGICLTTLNGLHDWVLFFIWPAEGSALGSFQHHWGMLSGLQLAYILQSIFFLVGFQFAAGLVRSAAKALWTEHERPDLWGSRR